MVQTYFNFNLKPGIRLSLSLRDEHVDSLCKRISSGLAALKQAHWYVPQNTLITTYKSLIEPPFDLL